MFKQVTKRLLALSGALLLLTALAAGCGGEETPASSTPSASSQGEIQQGTQAGEETAGTDATEQSGETGQASGATTAATKTNASGKTTTQGKTSTTTVGTLPPASGEVYSKPETDLGGRTITIMQNIPTTAKEYLNTVYGKKLAAHIQEIEDKYNCTINFTKVDYTGLVASIVSGQPICDIMDGGGPHLTGGYMKPNALLPLDDFAYLDFDDPKYDPFIVESMTIKGKHYGVQPVAQGFQALQYSMVLYYNKDLLKRAGVTDDLYALQEKGEWTWEKLREIALKVTDASQGIWGIGDNEFWFYNELVHSNGSDWIQRVDGKSTFTADDPAALEALNFYKQLAYEDKVLRVQPSHLEDRTIDTTDFFAGKIAFLPCYLERIQREGYRTMKDEYGVLYMPKGPQAKDYVNAVNWYTYYAIPTTVKNPNQVATILDAFCEPVLTEAEEKSILNVELAMYTQDAGSRDTINGLKDIMTRSYIMDSYNTLQWAAEGTWFEQLCRIAKNQVMPSAAISANKNSFNAKIKDENSYQW